MKIVERVIVNPKKTGAERYTWDATGYKVKMGRYVVMKVNGKTVWQLQTYFWKEL